MGQTLSDEAKPPSKEEIRTHLVRIFWLHRILKLPFKANMTSTK